MNQETEEYFLSLYSDDEVEQIARVAHSVAQSVNESFNIRKLPAWEVCYPWYRASFTKMVEEYLYRGISCRNRHQRWVRRMLAKGWTLGERNNELLTRSDLIEYNDLPIELRMQAKLLRASIMPFRKTKGINTEE